MKVEEREVKSKVRNDLKQRTFEFAVWVVNLFGFAQGRLCLNTNSLDGMNADSSRDTIHEIRATN